MPNQKNDTTSTEEGKQRVAQVPRAQLKHALIRVNFMSLGKVRALKRLHGLTSKLALIEIYLTMSCATNAVISKDAILDIAEDNEVKDAEGFFNYCIEERLIQPELNGFSNSVVIEDQEACAKKRDESAERVTRYRERKKDGCNALQTRSPDTDIDTDHVLPSLVKEGGAGETISADPVDIPEASDFSESRASAAIERWGKYITKTHKKPWGQLQADALMMRYHGRVEDLIRDVNGSVAAGWRTVCDCTQSKPNAPNSSHRETNFERNMRILKGDT